MQKRAETEKKTAMRLTGNTVVKIRTGMMIPEIPAAAGIIAGIITAIIITLIIIRNAIKIKANSR